MRADPVIAEALHESIFAMTDKPWKKCFGIWPYVFAWIGGVLGLMAVISILVRNV